MKDGAYINNVQDKTQLYNMVVSHHCMRWTSNSVAMAMPLCAGVGSECIVARVI